MIVIPSTMTFVLHLVLSTVKSVAFVMMLECATLLKCRYLEQRVDTFRVVEAISNRSLVDLKRHAACDLDGIKSKDLKHLRFYKSSQ